MEKQKPEDGGKEEKKKKTRKRGTGVPFSRHKFPTSSSFSPFFSVLLSFLPSVSCHRLYHLPHAVVKSFTFRDVSLSFAGCNTVASCSLRMLLPLCTPVRSLLFPNKHHADWSRLFSFPTNTTPHTNQVLGGPRGTWVSFSASAALAFTAA